MTDITCREIHINDHESIITLINRTWKIDTYLSSRKTMHRALHIMFMACLSASTYGKVAQKEGIIVGFILGRAKTGKKHTVTIMQVMRLIKDLVALLFAAQADRHNIFEYLKIPKVYRELIKGKKYTGVRGPRVL